MGKLSLNELASSKLSSKLVQATKSIKGGAESACHQDPTPFQIVKTAGET